MLYRLYRTSKEEGLTDSLHGASNNKEWETLRKNATASRKIAALQFKRAAKKHLLAFYFSFLYI